MELLFTIAHGAPAGMHVVLTQAGAAPLNQGVHGFVLAPPALDNNKKGPFTGYLDANNSLDFKLGFFGSRTPLRMKVRYGGVADLPFNLNQPVTVSFVPP